MRNRNRWLFFLLCLVAALHVSADRTRSELYGFTSATTQVFKVDGGPVYYHRIWWEPLSALGACTVELDGSDTGSAPWTTIIAGQNCTATGLASSAQFIYRYIRINVTALSGGQALVGYEGFNSDPSSGGGTVTANQGTAAAVTAGWPVINGTGVATTATWTSAATVDTALSIATIGMGTVRLSITPSGTVSSGTVTFESDDGSGTWKSLLGTRQDAQTAASTTVTVTAATQYMFGLGGAAANFRVRLNPVITGTGSVVVRLQVSGAASTTLVSVANTVSVNLATLNGSALDRGNGTQTLGTQRVTIASDSTGQVTLAAGSQTIGSVKLTDGTNTTAVKAASTAAAAADPSAVVALSPNSPLPSGTNTIGSVKLTDGTNTATVTAGGNVNVNCASGCVAGGSFADSTAFTFGTTAIGNTGAVVDDVATNTVAENSAGAVRMNTNRILYVDLSKTAANTTAIKVDGSASPIPPSATAALADNTANPTLGAVQVFPMMWDQVGANWDRLLGESTNGLWVNIKASNTVPVNVATINGFTPALGNGTASTNSLRVAVASDNTPFAVKTDQTTHGTTDLVAADITKVAGASIATGNGTAAGSIRISLASDSTGQVTLASGATVALAAGTAKIGVVTTDQTTHGTTDLVADDLVKVGGTAISAKAVPTGGIGQTAIPTYTNAIQLATYTIVADSITTGALVANTRKDVLSIEHTAGSTKTVKIRRIQVGGFQTSAVVGTVYCKIYRGTAATSAGTAVTPTPTNPATGAAEMVTKTLPTITAATLLYTNSVGFLSAATAQTGFPMIPVYDWQEAGETQPLTLRSGNLDTITIAIFSNVAHTLTLQISVIATEE